MGLRLPARRGEGISFVSTLATPRDQIEGKAPKGEQYLLEVDNEMVVPLGKKIRVITTAADVVHAWWIPALGAKQDAIPGFLRDTWFRAPSSLAPTGASAPSSAARSTASCRSWCASWRRTSTRSGSASRRRSPPSRPDDDAQTFPARRACEPRRESLRGELRRVPPGDRQRRAARSSRRSPATRSSPGPSRSRSTPCSTASPIPRCSRSSSSPTPRLPR